MTDTRIAITGIRPTGDLSVANYVGAMKPIIEMQEYFPGPINLFVADIHGLTDQEPELIATTRLDTVRSFLAAGVDPDKAILYLQTQIEAQTVILAQYLDRHVSIGELMRVPTLKDKLKDGQDEKSATVALARYPILMAADICIQDATDVPVGQDQIPHIEFTRDIVRRFNNEYGRGEAVLETPGALVGESLRIISLNGKGKMSKSQPAGAIFLKDTAVEAEKKIKRAQTAHPGETSDALDSHLLLSERLALHPNGTQVARLRDTFERHLAGQQVMGTFKGLMTEIVVEFLEVFQANYAQITDTDVQNVLKDGGERATEYADQVLDRVRKAMGFVR